MSHAIGHWMTLIDGMKTNSTIDCCQKSSCCGQKKVERTSGMRYVGQSKHDIEGFRFSRPTKQIHVENPRISAGTSDLKNSASRILRSETTCQVSFFSARLEQIIQIVLWL